MGSKKPQQFPTRVTPSDRTKTCGYDSEAIPTNAQRVLNGSGTEKRAGKKMENGGMFCHIDTRSQTRSGGEEQGKLQSE
jgi:hypothetical protein